MSAHYKLLNVGIKVKMFKDGRRVSDRIRDRFMENEGYLNKQRINDEIQKKINEKKYKDHGVLKFECDFCYLPWGENLMITEKFEIVIKWQVLGKMRFWGINYMNAHRIVECFVAIDERCYRDLREMLPKCG